jgi:hypothetical protein
MSDKRPSNLGIFDFYNFPFVFYFYSRTYFQRFAFFNFTLKIKVKNN